MHSQGVENVLWKRQCYLLKKAEKIFEEVLLALQEVLEDYIPWFPFNVVEVVFIDEENELWQVIPEVLITWDDWLFGWLCWSSAVVLRS